MSTRLSLYSAVLATLSAALLSVGCTSTQDPNTGRRADNSTNNREARTASERMGMGPLSPADKMFLVSASGSNKAEIAAAQMALDKSNDPTVRNFAQQVINDHRQAEERLQALAQRKGVDITTTPSQASRSASWELGKLSGTQFNNQYFAINHAAHMKTVASFQHAAANADDPDVRQFAQQMLPTLQSHMRQAGQHAGHDMSHHNTGNNNNTGGMNNR